MANEQTKGFSVGTEVYNIPVTKVDAFLQSMPNAKPFKDFSVGSETYSIPYFKVEAFKTSMPDAKEIGLEEPKSSDFVTDVVKQSIGGKDLVSSPLMRDSQVQDIPVKKKSSVTDEDLQFYNDVLDNARPSDPEATDKSEKFKNIESKITAQRIKDVPYKSIPETYSAIDAAEGFVKKKAVQSKVADYWHAVGKDGENLGYTAEEASKLPARETDDKKAVDLAADMLGKIKKSLADVDQAKKNGGVENFAVGAGRDVYDYYKDYFTLPSQLKDNVIITKLNDKLSRIDNGSDESVTPGEAALIESMKTVSDAAKVIDEQMPESYRLGKSIGTSMGFMLDYMLAGGALEAIRTGIIKSVAKSRVMAGAKAMSKLSKAALNIGLKTAETGAHLPMYIPLYKDIAINVSNGQNPAEAVGNALWKAGVDVSTEKYFENMIPTGAKGYSAINKVLSRAGSALKDHGVYGIVKAAMKEDFEEIAANGLNGMRDVYQGKATPEQAWKAFTDLQMNARTLASVAVMTGAMGGVIEAQRGLVGAALARDYKKAGSKLDGILKSSIDDLISNRDITPVQIMNATTEMAKEHADSKASVKEKIQTIGDAVMYANAALKKESFDEITRSKVEAEFGTSTVNGKTYDVTAGKTALVVDHVFETEEEANSVAQALLKKSTSPEGQFEAVVKSVNKGFSVEIKPTALHPNVKTAIADLSSKTMDTEEEVVAQEEKLAKEKPIAKITEPTSAEVDTKQQAQEILDDTRSSVVDKIVADLHLEDDVPMSEQSKSDVVDYLQAVKDKNGENLTPVEEHIASLYAKHSGTEAKASTKRTADVVETEMALLEDQMANEEDPSKSDALSAKYNKLEKEAEYLERGSVYRTPITKLREVLSSLRQKEKTLPNGYGIFTELRDISESEGVVDRYTTDRGSLTRNDVISDFKRALNGNPKTWYADGLLLRESMNLASEMGISTRELIDAYTQQYLRDGYDSETAYGVTLGKIKDIFGDTKFEKQNKAIPSIGTVLIGRERVRQSILNTHGGTKFKPSEVDAVMSVYDAMFNTIRGSRSLDEVYDEYVGEITDNMDQIGVSPAQQQKAKGAIDFQSGKAIVALLKTSDVSTLLHEVGGHLGRRLLEQAAAIDEEFKVHYENAANWSGATKQSDGTWKWGVPAEEKFARAFEQYMKEGVAPNDTLYKAFEMLKEWMRKIYKSKDFELSDEMREAFKAMLSGKTEVKPLPANQKKAPLLQTELEKGVSDRNDSGKTMEFFSKVVKGEAEKYIPIKPWVPLLSFDMNQESFRKIFDEYKGNFDIHIATSIPTFRETQVKVGNAIARLYGGKKSLMYDIGGSEGGFAKSVTRASDGNIKTVNLDPNADMQAIHNASPVKGSEFVKEAFQEGFEWDGVEYPRHEPKEKSDVVHESMVFQFIKQAREAFVKEIKLFYLKPNGIFVTEEKFAQTNNDLYKANEKVKAEYKDEYYTKEQQAAKTEDVLVGMKEDQANVDTYEQILANYFKYVDQYWDSGNFKGYVASDSRKAVNDFLKTVGDTGSKFTNVQLKNNIPVDRVAPKGGTLFQEIDEIGLNDNMPEELDRLRNTPKGESNGGTYNMDGTPFDGDLLVAIRSGNFKSKKISAANVISFLKGNKGIITTSDVKLGLYRFDDKDMISTDVSVNTALENKNVAMDIAKYLRQESVYNAKEDRVYKTGFDGKSPRKVSDEEANELIMGLRGGYVPTFVSNALMGKEGELLNEINKDKADEGYSESGDYGKRVADGIKKLDGISSTEEQGRLLGGERNVEASILTGGGIQATAEDRRGNVGDVGRGEAPLFQKTNVDPTSDSLDTSPRIRTSADPIKTVTAYKLFRINKNSPGKLFPLFVDANVDVPIGVWIDAGEGKKNDKGKVESKLGGLAFRPGWHAGDYPVATHIGEGGQPPKYRPINQVWAEIEMSADVDWQTVANKNGLNAQGKIVGVKAHITDGLPKDGFYRYKTNPNMNGTWLIGGSIKVVKVLTDEEVFEINKETGIDDLPRRDKIDLKKAGFNKDVLFQEEIEVDGVKRPTLNSKGQLIHPTEEGIKNFWRWFKGSKVVDAEGRPLIVYHGSDSLNEITEFAPQLKKTIAVRPFSFFATDKWEAKRYTSKNKIGEFYLRSEKLFDPESLSSKELQSVELLLKTDGVVSRFERMVSDIGFKNWQSYMDETWGTSDMTIKDAMMKVLKVGSDNFILLETREFQQFLLDNGYDGFKTNEGDGGNYAVFSPTQIKSATGNIGEFDSENPSILFQTISDEDVEITVIRKEGNKRVTSKEMMSEDQKENLGKIAQHIGEFLSGKKSASERTVAGLAYLSKFNGMKTYDEIVKVLDKDLGGKKSWTNVLIDIIRAEVEAKDANDKPLISDGDVRKSDLTKILTSIKDATSVKTTLRRLGRAVDLIKDMRNDTELRIKMAIYKRLKTELKGEKNNFGTLLGLVQQLASFDPKVIFSGERFNQELADKYLAYISSLVKNKTIPGTVDDFNQLLKDLTTHYVRSNIEQRAAEFVQEKGLQIKEQLEFDAAVKALVEEFNISEGRAKKELQRQISEAFGDYKEKKAPLTVGDLTSMGVEDLSELSGKTEDQIQELIDEVNDILDEIKLLRRGIQKTTSILKSFAEIGPEYFDKMTLPELRKIRSAYDMASKGVETHTQLLLVTKVDAIKAAKKVYPTLKKGFLKSKDLLDRLKGHLMKLKLGSAISNWGANIALTYGDKSWEEIAKTLDANSFSPISEGISRYEKQRNDLKTKYKKALLSLINATGGTKVATQDKGMSNHTRNSVLVTMYMKAREIAASGKEFNSEGKSIISRFVVESAKEERAKGNSKFADLIEDVYTKAPKRVDVNGNETIDQEKLFNDFIPEMKNLIKVMDEISAEIAPLIQHTAEVVRGSIFNKIANHFHQQAIKAGDADAASVDEFTNSVMGFGTKASALHNRTLNKKINFNGIYVFGRYVDEALLDYHVTKEIRKVKAFFDALDAIANEEGVDQQVKDGLTEYRNAMIGQGESVTKGQLHRTPFKTDVSDKVVSLLRRRLYFQILAHPNKVVKEYTTNLFKAFSIFPKEMIEGMKYIHKNSKNTALLDYMGQIDSENQARLVDVLEFAGSSQLGRELRDKYDIEVEGSGIMNTYSTNYGMGDIAVDFIAEAKWFKKVDDMSTQMLAMSDKATMQPLIVGSFLREYKKLTGSEFDADTFRSDPQYRVDNEKEIKKAMRVADKNTEQIVNTQSDIHGNFNVIANADKKGILKAMQYFVWRFSYREAATAGLGVKMLFSRNTTAEQKLQGAQKVAVVWMTNLAYVMMGQALYALVVGDKKDREEWYGKITSIDYWLRQMFGQIFTLGTSKIPNIQKLAVSWGLEWLNKQYIISKGEQPYNPRVHAVTQTKLSSPTSAQDMLRIAIIPPFSNIVGDISSLYSKKKIGANEWLMIGSDVAAITAIVPGVSSIELMVKGYIKSNVLISPELYALNDPAAGQRDMMKAMKSNLTKDEFEKKKADAMKKFFVNSKFEGDVREFASYFSSNFYGNDRLTKEDKYDAYLRLRDADKGPEIIAKLRRKYSIPFQDKYSTSETSFKEMQVLDESFLKEVKEYERAKNMK